MFNALNLHRFVNTQPNLLKINQFNITNLLWSARNKLSTKPKNHYEILKLSRNCTSKEIKDAYITLSKQYHPDKNKGDPKAQEEFVKVSEAYNVLIKPESRRDYDFNLGNFTNPSRVYRSGKRDDFYEVHRYDRYDPHYRDPWKDPSFYRNRNFEDEDKNDENYYGIKGLKKQPNSTLLFWLAVFAVVGFFVQISIIRLINARTRFTRDLQDEENRRHLEFVKARAEYYGTRERQMEAFKRRAGIIDENNPPESSTVEDRTE